MVSMTPPKVVAARLARLAPPYEKHFRLYRRGFERRYRLLHCYKCGAARGYFLAGTEDNHGDNRFFEIRWQRQCGGSHVPRTGNMIILEPGAFYKIEMCLCSEYAPPAFRVSETSFGAFAAFLNNFPADSAAFLDFDLDSWDLKEK